MGLMGLTEICQSLLKHGRASDTPVALVEKGTTPNQRVLVADLTSIADLVAESDVHGPTLLIVGDRKSTRLNSSHVAISYAVFCLKKKKHDERAGAPRQSGLRAQK